eukprot:11193680-Lingulodinium_polyedra.AAC.1
MARIIGISFDFACSAGWLLAFLSHESQRPSEKSRHHLLIHAEAADTPFAERLPKPLNHHAPSRPIRTRATDFTRCAP